ncbi:dimethylamine monooxygenase subunit DmmA family protein [Roseovarius nanhaiticus]|uniref:dimethylamine monooxygenase subunit DmmA family protein n=1 Tax=Roseovarius nanhaiticus TaxID=573024 RepID=UPI002490A04F|nr:dimethylamine monooxygenase subunit DmmA family protein [Roseovarius nanhaiticus]
MSKFDFPPSIKSRPVWGSLEARPGKHHLMIADGEGAEAILAIAGPDLMAKSHIIYIPKGTDYEQKLRDQEPAILHVGPSYEASLQRIRRVLQDAHMGLQVYLAGTEGLMGQAMQEAVSHGIPHTAIQTEHRGSVARRMQCVHCKGITEDVEVDPFVCSHCGLNLFVRDHYSRRLAAYQGVCVDAEDPGNVPEQKGIYE